MYLLTIDNRTYHINLMPMTIGSFDVLIGRDWLSLQHAKIICYEKVIRLPLPNSEALILYGGKFRKNLKINYCTKAQQYLYKKCNTFLAHIVDKKSKKNQRHTSCMWLPICVSWTFTWDTTHSRRWISNRLNPRGKTQISNEKIKEKMLSRN